MIIEFTCKNFLSFRDKISFSMLKSNERRHINHIAEVKKYKMKLLPIAAIYGANASGKSNFVKSLEFTKNLIVGKETSSDPFLLDKTYSKQPTVIEILLLIQNTVYKLGFSCLDGKIISEYLFKILPFDEISLYERNKGDIILGDIFSQESIKVRLDFYSEGTKENQLFLTKVASEKKDKAIKQLQDFTNIYEWFKKCLYILTPDTKSLFPYISPKVIDGVNNLIPFFDLGFTKIENVSNNVIDKEEISVIENFFKHSLSMPIHIADLGITIERNDNGYIRTQSFFLHKNTSNQKQEFPLSFESDGSQRMLDLMPPLVFLTSDKPVVFIIDELDRSIHHLLIKEYIKRYLDSCSPEHRSQLIFTTHDVTLMSQDIFRRDELWITDRNHQNISTLHSLSCYADLRADKDIRKSYLSGRFGGIPRILL